MDWKMMLPILAIFGIIMVSGCITIQEGNIIITPSPDADPIIIPIPEIIPMPDDEFTSQLSCRDTCVAGGYDTGDCQWPSEGEGKAIAGSCLIEDSRHCGLPDQCNCYCWNEEGAAPEPPPEEPPETILPAMSWDECAAWATAEGHQHYTINKETLEACEDYNFIICDLRGGWVVSWNLLRGCCISTCSTD